MQNLIKNCKLLTESESVFKFNQKKIPVEAVSKVRIFTFFR
jgi:hypothetical protein